MDEFLPIGSAPMSSDETPKIELTVTDAPSIAPEAAKPEAVQSAAPKMEAVETEAPKAEAPKSEAKIEPPKPEAKAEPEKIEPRIEQKAEPKIEAPTLPPAPQIAESAAIVRLKRLQPKPEPIAPRPRSSRFALLAACVAIAASFGAIGGSLGVAKFAPMFNSPLPQAVTIKDHVADEVKALKENVAQLRGAMKSLSENLVALKTSVTAS